MQNLDDTLQTQLAALESGVPLETVLAGLPAGASSLAPLIRLAAASRSLPHPQMRPEAVRAHRVRVMSAAQAGTSRPFFPNWLRNHKSWFAFGGGLAVFAVMAVFALGIALFLEGPASANYARLADVQGWVEVAPSADSNDWHFIADGERVRQGQRVRTYAESGATLVFFDGTRSTVGPDADLTLTKLDGGWGNVLKVQIAQVAGETVHDVIPLRGSSSVFQVNTPTGRANVHGTSFKVAVNPGGDSLFSVSHGKVAVANARSEVFLASGQATAVLSEQDPAKPAYQFTLEGVVDEVQENGWTVSGIQITRTDQTEVLGVIEAGDAVYVQGRIPAPGELIADQIEPTETDRRKARFTGMIETLGGVPGEWIIGGHTVLVDAETELSDGLDEGIAVEVSFIALPNDGGWLAKEIAVLDDPDQVQQPTTTPTTTSTPTVTPDPLLPVATATFTPTPTVTSTPGTQTPTPTVTATPTVIPKNDTNRCDNRTQQHPQGLRLAQRFSVTYEEIMDWFCKGFGFGEIDLAYSLSQETGKPVSDIFSMRSSGLGWGVIKKQLAAQVTPSPEPAIQEKKSKLPKGNGAKK